jgi:hypothetical protein
VAACYNARQDNSIYYSTIQYTTITHMTQNNTQHSRQPSISKITKKYPQHTLLSYKTQKRVEPNVDWSALLTTRYTKHAVKHTVQYSTQFHNFHQDQNLTTPHYPYIDFTSHSELISLSSPHLADLHPTSNSLHFTSHNTFQPPFLEILDFLLTSKSLHFSSLHFT